MEFFVEVLYNSYMKEDVEIIMVIIRLLLKVSSLSLVIKFEGELFPEGILEVNSN